MGRRRIGLLTVLILALAACGGGSSESAGEGITIHGEWTIDVYNEDGTLDQRHEFSNAITQGGVFLVRALAREVLLSTWSVQLDNSDPNQAPCNTGVQGWGCYIVEPHHWWSQTPPSPVNSFDLALSFDASIAELSLSGTHVANNDGAIEFVSTHISVCPWGSEVVKTDCMENPTGGGFPFSKRVLDDPIEVFVGQVLEVEVVYSFPFSAP